MKRLTVAQVAEELRLPAFTVRWMCEQEKLPPGYVSVIKKGRKRNTFYIFKTGGSKDEQKGEVHAGMAVQ